MFVYTNDQVYYTTAVTFNSITVSFMVGDMQRIERFENVRGITDKAIDPIDTDQLVDGAVLIARSPLPMDDGSGDSLTVGKEYVVRAYEDLIGQFYVIDDHGHEHWFDFGDVDIYFTIK